MTNWYVYMHINIKDQKAANKALKDMQKHLRMSNIENKVNIYVVKFGPTVHSDVNLIKYDRTGEHQLLRMENKGVKDVVPNLKKIKIFFTENKINLKALCIYAHGAGAYLGPWSRKEPFLTIKDVVKYMLLPFNIKFVVFDSCFQGNMSCLYELPEFVKVVVASPAFQPFSSVLSTQLFTNLPKLTSIEDLKKYAHDLNCEWRTLSKVNWKCNLVFDMQYIPTIAYLVKNNFKHLKFDKKSQIDNEDTNLHDLYAAARNIPILQNIIIASTKLSCKLCFQSCNKRVRGVSMEAHIPRKWVSAYLSTKWYKEIVKNEKGFENERVERLIDIISI